MQLTSPTIADGQPIPLPHAGRRCGGDNRPPGLSWSGAPQRTRAPVHRP